MCSQETIKDLTILRKKFPPYLHILEQVSHSIKCMHSKKFQKHEKVPLVIVRKFGYTYFVMENISKSIIDILKKILVEEKEFSDKNLDLMKEAYLFKKNFLITKEGDLYLTIDSLIEINNITVANTQPPRMTLCRCQVKPAGYNYFYMDFNIIDFHLQILIDNSNECLVSKNEFVDKFLRIHPFVEGNGRTAKLLCYKK